MSPVLTPGEKRILTEVSALKKELSALKKELSRVSALEKDICRIDRDVSDVRRSHNVLEHRFEDLPVQSTDRDASIAPSEKSHQTMQTFG